MAGKSFADILNEEPTEPSEDELTSVERLVKLVNRADGWKRTDNGFLGKVDELDVVLAKVGENYAVATYAEGQELEKESGDHVGFQKLYDSVFERFRSSYAEKVQDILADEADLSITTISLDQAIKFATKGRSWVRHDANNAEYSTCDVAGMTVMAIKFKEGGYSLRIHSPDSKNLTGDADVFTEWKEKGNLKTFYEDTLPLIRRPEERKIVRNKLKGKMPEIPEALNLDEVLEFASGTKNWTQAIAGNADYYVAEVEGMKIMVAKFKEDDKRYSLKVFSQGNNNLFGNADVFDETGYNKKIKDFYEVSIDRLSKADTTIELRKALENIETIEKVDPLTLDEVIGYASSATEWVSEEVSNASIYKTVINGHLLMAGKFEEANKGYCLRVFDNPNTTMYSEDQSIASFEGHKPKIIKTLYEKTIPDNKEAKKVNAFRESSERPSGKSAK